MRSSQKPWTVELAADYGVVGQVAACHNAVRPRSIRLNRHKTYPEPQQDRGTISIEFTAVKIQREIMRLTCSEFLLEV